MGYRKFFVIKVQSSSTVIIILDHSAHRDIKSQLIKNVFTYIDLSSSAVHQYKIRKP